MRKPKSIFEGYTYKLLTGFQKKGGTMTDNLDITIDLLAPEFKLPASTGSEIALADFRSKNNVYLFFVREFN